MKKLNSLLFGLICLASARVVDAVPMSFLKWKSPCGPSSTVTISPVLIDRSIMFEELARKTTNFANYLNDLKSKYTPPRGSRVTQSRFIASVDSFNIHGLNLPTVWNADNYDTTSTLLEDFKNLSRLAFFLEQVMKEEEKCEYGEFMKWMKPVKNILYGILCDLQIAIESTGDSTVIQHLSRDIMSIDSKTLRNRSIMFKEAYIIFYKAENYVNLLNNKYKALSILNP